MPNTAADQQQPAAMMPMASTSVASGPAFGTDTHGNGPVSIDGLGGMGLGGGGDVKARGAAIYIDNLTYTIPCTDPNVAKKGIWRRKSSRDNATDSSSSNSSDQSTAPAVLVADTDIDTSAALKPTAVDSDSPFAHAQPGDIVDGRKVILRDFTCIFPSGQLCAILGPSGAGKSTLRM